MTQSKPDDPAAEQAGHVLMWHAVAIKNHGLTQSKYEFEVTDNYGNKVSMQGTMYGPDYVTPQYSGIVEDHMERRQRKEREGR